jgi:hypothetical protein
MASLIGRIPARQIVPRSSGSQDPEHSIQHGTRVLRRPASLLQPCFRLKERLQHGPLRIAQIHASVLPANSSIYNCLTGFVFFEMTSRNIPAGYLGIPRNIPSDSWESLARCERGNKALSTNTTDQPAVSNICGSHPTLQSTIMGIEIQAFFVIDGRCLERRSMPCSIRFYYPWLANANSFHELKANAG